MRIIFCGDRNWTDKTLIREVILRINLHFPDLTIIEGEAPGADTLSRQVAKEFHGIQVIEVPANWEEHRKAAGPIRNTEMLITHKADGVVGFHPNISASKGTKNMIYQARVAKKPVWLSQFGLEMLEPFIAKLKEQKVNPLGKLHV